MPAFEFICLKPLRVGDRTLEPGETTLVPNTWNAGTLKIYLDGGYLRHGQVIDAEFEQAPAFTGAPQGYEDRVPLEPRKSAEQEFDGSRGWRCWNCRRLCYLPGDLDGKVEWSCWGCNQEQTIVQVTDQQQPINVVEEMTRRGLAKDPTDNQVSVHHNPNLLGEKLCEEQDCIRTRDHSGNHRNQHLREWEQKPREIGLPLHEAIRSSHIDARSPINPEAPIPGRR